MKVLLCAASALALGSAVAAHAGDQPLYQPPSAWVKPLPVPDKVKPNGAAADVLLSDTQIRLQPGDTETYSERAIRIDAPEGLQKAATIVQVWNPLTDVLIFHHARILRNGRVIDLLSGGKRFTVLRRETNLEAAMIDGQLTATLQPEGLQVGDVVDLAFTVDRKEPAFAGHAVGATALGHAGSIGKMSVRLLWPQVDKVAIWKTDDIPQAAMRSTGGWTEATIVQDDATSPEPPQGAPVYDKLFGLLLAADYGSWPAVSAAAYPLYDKAATLPANSPLKAEIARIRAAHHDSKGRTLAALQLVEEKTRYLFVGMDAGGLTPAPADVTWARRFGDCKGKTVLLLALLRGLDVQAEPVLVNTILGEALDRLQPTLGLFDHVLVRAILDGRSYWLDATRMGDQSLDVLKVPNDRWGLPLQPAGTGLERMLPPIPDKPLVDTLVQLDLHDGADKPAKVHEEIVMRGDLALFISLAMRQATKADGDKALRAMLTSDRSWLQADKLAFAYDPRTMEARAILDGTGLVPFSGPSDQDWSIEGLSLAFDPDTSRPSPYHHEAPFAVTYPAYVSTRVEAMLPAGASQEFSLGNADPVDRTVAGVAYSRSGEIRDGRLTATASARALQPQVSASDLQAAAGELRSIADYTPYLRHYMHAGRGQQGAVSAPSSTSSTEDAEVAFAHKDYEAAEAGFTKAIAAAPSARLYYDRAAARSAIGQLGLARQDLKAALKLEPDHSLSLLALGRLDLAQGDTTAADKRFKAALASAADRRTTILWSIASTYQNAGHAGLAVPYLDELLNLPTPPLPRYTLLNQRCWARAQWGRELDRAKEDCDAALKLKPGEIHALDSRALVELRSGDLADALRDYDAALQGNPRLAGSLWGRSLVEARLGQGDAGRKDAAAALRLDPKVKSSFESWGVL